MSEDKQRVSILVVDDDEGIRVTLLAALEEAYEVEACESAVHASKVLKNSVYDLVLCDLMMPMMTGAELYESLPPGSPMRARFVFMSGGSLPSHVLFFLSEVGPPMLKKPFTIEKLRESVSTALARRKSVDLR